MEGEKGCECGEGGDRLSVSIHGMVDVWVGGIKYVLNDHYHYNHYHQHMGGYMEDHLEEWFSATVPTGTTVVYFNSDCALATYQ